MTKSAIAAGKKAIAPHSKHSRSEGESHHTTMNKDNAVSSRNLVPIRWKSDAFMEMQGLHDDFA